MPYEEFLDLVEVSLELFRGQKSSKTKNKEMNVAANKIQRLINANRSGKPVPKE